MKEIKTIEEFWENLNQKLNVCIGKLTVPAMINTHPLTKEVHAELLEMAHWIDETLEELTSKSNE